MTTFPIEEVEGQLAELISRAGHGEEVIITRDAVPVARLLPYSGFGSMRGRAWLDDSFWEPLPEDELKLWEGG
jgi:prevent-host-death family protein